MNSSWARVRRHLAMSRNTTLIVLNDPSMAKSESDSKRDEAYSQFLQVRADYIARERAASDKVDQVLIAGAAGALALSVTFIEKIAQHPSPSTSLILGGAWLLLLFALAGALVNYELRARTYQLAYKRLDDALREGKDPDFGKVENLNSIMGFLNIACFVLLFLGVVFLVLFAYKNVPFKEELKMSDSPTITVPQRPIVPTPGHVVPTPGYVKPRPERTEVVPPPPPPPPPQKK